MRKALIALSALAALVALLVATTASGARRSPTAVPGCAPGSLNLVKPNGFLTIGTDNPAYPPWYGGTPKSPWKVSDPSSGQGYESAFAYALAKTLGFATPTVHWIYVPFANSYRPGKKPFDFYLAQVSILPERVKAATFSKPYYYVNQAVVGRKGKPIASVRSVAGLRKFKLGAQLGTSSYQYIVDHIKPTTKPLVYKTNDLAVQALKNGQIDGIVVDLPTAFYVSAAQVPDGTIVGQFPSGASKEGFGLVFAKGNPLVACVNKAIDRLWKNGTIKALQRIWLAKAAGARVLK